MHGHLHDEQWQVQRDVLEKKPIGVNYIVGSVTTEHHRPPSFAVIYLDPNSLVPVEYETYVFDLDYANKYDIPKWEFSHSYT